MLQAMPPDTATQAQTAAQTPAIAEYVFVEGVYDRLGNITAPTLIFAGLQDAVVPVAGILDLFDKCASSSMCL